MPFPTHIVSLEKSSVGCFPCRHLLGDEEAYRSSKEVDLVDANNDDKSSQFQQVRDQSIYYIWKLMVHVICVLHRIGHVSSMQPAWLSQDEMQPH